MGYSIFNRPNDLILPHRIPSIRLTTYILLAAALACGGEGPTTPVPPGPAPVAAVQFDVAAVSLYVGQARTVAVVARDAGGSTLSGRAIAWSSSDYSDLTVYGQVNTSVR